MAYFADLTPYAYDGSFDEGVLNIGWLGAGRRFPTSPLDPALVTALMRCCRRPVNLYRGYHQCEFCGDAPGMTVMNFAGRRVHLGNGEIRVLGADQRWYAAPTLIAHYVAIHHYAPPTVFRDAVIAAASRIPCIDEPTFAALQGLSSAERFQLCLGLLEVVNAAVPSAWGQRAFAQLVVSAPAINPDHPGDRRELVDRALRATVLPADDAPQPPRWLHAATRNTMQMLAWANRSASADEENLELAADTIEALLGSPIDFSDHLSRLTLRQRTS